MLVLTCRCCSGNLQFASCGRHYSAGFQTLPFLIQEMGDCLGSSSKNEFTPGKGTLLTLLLVAMLNCMGGAAVAPALPAISAAFPQTSETLVSMIITMPSLAVAATGFFAGMVADRVGKAKTLAASLVLFTVAGLSGAVLPTVETILISRFVMGIGIAGISTASTALVSDYYDADMRAKVFGWQSAASGVSVLVLETAGGFLALLGWRVPFCVYVVGIGLLVMVALFIRELPVRQSDAINSCGSDDQRNRAAIDEQDGVRAQTLSKVDEEPSKVALEESVNSTNEGSRSSRKVSSVVAICLFIAFSTQILSFLVPSKMPYLITGFGADTATSGLFLGAFGIANVASSIIYAHRQSYSRRSTMSLISFAALTAGCLLMGVAPNIWVVLIGVILVGLGVGTVMPLFMNWLASKSTAENSGKYMGAYTTAINLGQFACSLVAGGMLAIFGTYQAIFLVAAAFGGVIMFCMLALRGFIDSNRR